MAGFQVRTASSGPEALALCEREGFDVVLSDVRMPGGMNGHELVRGILAQRPQTRTLLMSGFDDIQCDGGCGPDRWCVSLRKPFLPKDAVAAVIEALERKAPPPRPIAHSQWVEQGAERLKAKSKAAGER